MPNEEYCGGKARIEKLANDALKEIEKIETHQINKELELELKEVKKDLNLIIMDNHHR